MTDEKRKFVKGILKFAENTEKNGCVAEKI